MTEVGSIFVRLSGQDVGLSTLLQKADAETQKAADSALRLQAQYARLAATQGNTAQATAILSNALQNNGGASERAVISVSQQLATVERGSSIYQEFGQSAASSLTGMIGPAALATAAIGGLAAVGKSFADAFQFKTQLDQSIASIKVLLSGVRESGEVFAGAARFAQEYKLTQQETTDAIQSSVPVLRNSKASIEEVLGVFARLKVLKPEKTFGDAARAIGELQAGQIVSIVDQFNLSRSAANKMKDEIAKGGDAVQILSNYLTSAGVGMDALAVQTQGAAGKIRELAQAQEQLKLAQADFAQGPGLVLLQAQIQTTIGATRLLTNDTQAMGQSILQAAQQGSFGFHLFDTIMGGTLTKMATYQAQANASAATASQNAAATDTWNAALAAHSALTTADTDIEQQRANVLAQAAGLRALAAAAEIGYANALEQTGVQARAAAVAAEQKANADQLASVNAQTHAVSQNALAQQAQLAANVLLAAGPAGARAAALLAGSSSQVDILTAAYYRLAASQAAAGQAATRAALDKQTPRQLVGPDSEAAGVRASQRAAIQEDRAARIKAASDAATAERGYQQTLGNTGPALAHARAELNQLTAGSAAYINKQNEIAQLEKQAEKRGRGGTKISDQQKLNNQLLTDQEKADNQYEDAEAAHQDRLLKIQIDFAKKSLEQQKLNEVSKRQSQADFYDRLTSSDLNKKKGGAEALKAVDAEYQAAYQKSQELAQAGNAKLAADYLALKSKQAGDELSYQESVAKAKEDKDKAEVSRLEAIHKLRVDAQAEEEKQLLAGGDTNVNAKQQALSDEQAQYESQQDKIATSAERAADRQIAAADRAGKKIDANNTKLGLTKTAYDQIAPSAGGSAPNTATNGGSGAGITQTTTPQAANSDPVAAAIAQLQDALAGRLDAIKGAADNTTSAVRGLQGKFAT